MVLFVLFVILAFIPGYKGFSMSDHSSENGTVSDADFDCLLQSSLMAVLSNFATAWPLLPSMRGSGPPLFFWGVHGAGTLSAVVSFVMYSYTPTCWSSVVSFVGSVASAASVLVLAVATARERTADEEDADQLAGPSMVWFLGRDAKRKTE